MTANSPANPANLLPGDGPMRLKQCRRGPMLYNINDTHVADLLDRYGEYAEFEVALFEQLIRPGDLVVDAGANIGAFTVALAKIVGPKGRVHSFEPQPQVWRTLVANTAINGLDNVQCWNAAVGAGPGELVVPAHGTDATYNWGGVSLVLGKDEKKGIPVRVMSIDELNLPRCRFIKADVEGMETALVEGAMETIRRCRPILYLEAEYAELVPPMLELLAQVDYRCHWHLAPYARDADQNWFGNPVEPRWQGIGAMNILATPATAQISGLKPVVTGNWRIDCNIPKKS